MLVWVQCSQLSGFWSIYTDNQSTYFIGVLNYSLSQQPWETGALLEEEEIQPSLESELLCLGSNLVHL